jgi:hypothetical protein
VPRPSLRAIMCAPMILAYFATLRSALCIRLCTVFESNAPRDWDRPGNDQR